MANSQFQQGDQLQIIFLCFLPVLFLLFVGTQRRRRRRDLPPGSLGLPFIGQTFALLRAMRSNRGEQWLRRRVAKYGPVSKLSVLGSPTVLVSTAAANKLFFCSPEEVASQKPASVRRIIGERNMLELSGDAHKRVRGAVVAFLKPEMLKRYVGKIDVLVARHLRAHWAGRDRVTVLPLMKILAFDFISAHIFGIEDGPLRESMEKDFCAMTEGLWAIPVDLPFTKFRRSLRGSERARAAVARLLREQKAALEQGRCSAMDNLIAYLASLVGDDGKSLLSDEEIIDNVVVVMVAGHDTSSCLMTFMIRQLANDPETYAAVLAEQEEIAKSRQAATGGEEALTWEDISKMKYTWRVAQEVLRFTPPIFGNYRTATRDIEFEGFTIPKGWKVFSVAHLSHLDAKYFKEPLEFDPSRFENQSAAGIQPFTYVPFGAGSRICPGSELAKAETLVMIHHIVTKFKWKLCFCGEGEDVYGWAPFATPREGLPIHLEQIKF